MNQHSWKGQQSKSNMLKLHPSKMRQRKMLVILYTIIASSTVYYNTYSIANCRRRRKNTWASRSLEPAQKIRTTHTPSPWSARQEVGGARIHARWRTHVLGKATGEAIGQTQPPTHYNGHKLWSNGKDEKLQLSRALCRNAFRYLCIYKWPIVW